MKVLILAESFPSKLHQYGGIFIFELARVLQKFCDISVINPRPWFPAQLSGKFVQYQAVPLRENIGRLQIYRPNQLVLPRLNRLFFMGFTFLLSTLSLLRREMRDFQFDLVCSTSSGPPGFAAVLIGKLYKKPVLLDAQGSDINAYTKYFCLRKMVLFSIRHADFIVTKSNDLKRKVISLGVDDNEAETIPNGVDLNTFVPRDKAFLRNRIGTSDDKKIIVYVGNLAEVKGVSFLIQAFRLLRARVHDVQLLIIGDGYLSKDLKNLAKKLGIDKDVTFLGQQAHDAIPDYIGVSDVLALPSLSEGMPNVLKEALACGVPVVATSVGGIPELITSDDLGILVPPANADLLCDAIERALSRRWDHEHLVEYARQFTWERTAESYMKVFDRLTAMERR